MNGFTTSSASIQPTFLSRLVNTLQNQLQIQLDKLVPWTATRWVIFAIFFALFGVRIYLLEGYYIVTYGLGIYLLHLFINFLAPREDPDSDGPLLPNYDHDEYKPFVRKLPEYKFWYAGARALTISFFMTLFSIFDLPVFWPILVIYFCVLFFITMKRQVKHMMKWKYLPFSFGKPRFRGDNASHKKTALGFRGGVQGPAVSRGPLGASGGAGAASMNGPASSHLPNSTGGGTKRINTGFMGNVPKSSMRSAHAQGYSQPSSMQSNGPSVSQPASGGGMKANGIGVSAGTAPQSSLPAFRSVVPPTMTGMLGGGGGSGPARPGGMRSVGASSGPGVSGM